MNKVLTLLALSVSLWGQNQCNLLSNGWLGCSILPSTCSSGVSPNVYLYSNTTLYFCLNGTYVAPGTGSGLTSATGNFTSSSSFTITHNLNTSNPLVALYDTNGYLLGSTSSAANVTSVQVTSSSTVAVVLSTSASGTWVVVAPTSSGSTLSPPSFSVGTGTYNNNQSVSITAAGGVTICYTTDGSTPTASTPGSCSHGSTYSTAIAISVTATQLQAIATEASFVNSSVTSATYTLQVATPTSSPTLPSTVSSCSGCLTFSTTTSGATIHYNTTGPTAACTDTLFSGALSAVSTTTYYWVGCLTNYANSAQSSGTLTISSTLSNPTFSPPAGTYGSAQTVTITYPAGSTGCWATSNLTQGATPGTCGSGWTTYSGTITVSSTETLYAYATEVGFTNSSTVNAAYTISSGIGFSLLASGHSATGGTCPVSLASVNTSGNTALFVSISNFGTISNVNVSGTIGGTSDGNTWGPLFSSTAATTGAMTFGTTGALHTGTNHIITVSGSGCTATSVALIGATGTANAPQDQIGGFDAITSTTCTPANSITPTQSNDGVLTAQADNDTSDNTSGTVPLVPSGYTLLVGIPFVSGTNVGLSVAYEIQSTATATQPIWNVGGSNSVARDCHAVSVKH